MTKYRIAYAKIQTTTTLDGVETLHDPLWYAVLFADDKRIDGYNSTVEKDQNKALRNLAYLIVSLAGFDVIGIDDVNGNVNHIHLTDLPTEIQPFIAEQLARFHPTVRAKITGRQNTQ